MKKLFFFLFSCFVSFIFANDVELSSDGKLRYYEAEQESFFVNSSANTVVRVTDGKMEQKNYDERQRLIKTITWTKDLTKIEKIKEYFYEPESFIAKTIITENFVTMKKVEEIFDAYNLIQQKNYILLQPDLLSEGQANEELEYTKKNTYNSANRILTTTILYENKIPVTEKTVYKYLVADDIADIFLYRDDILQKSVVHSTSKDWIETVIFADSMNIVTFYENATAIKEDVYKNGEKIREIEL